ncbi:hypothetical protein PAXRUDRAFT_18175 [Paxillus rubicundulus Ve08.2h10]|uniref:Uncharacterized protein n=1 Tax=Paxillus rubicundulus Ve08.2h10 TaxID=930991 RepID=A0A0D0CZ33_9AGAM|nr:hypothetical protein PAXRUDRAFT_18175 [Paxillus rubicundulus Ve08.2h10]
MSSTKYIETALAKSAHIVEGILLDLKHQSKLDEVTTNTWSNAVNVINGELSITRHLFQNVTGVCIPTLLIAAQMMAQTNEEIQVFQQWPALLEVCLMRDGIDAHPWSCLHLAVAPEASSAIVLSIEVIDEVGLSSTTITATPPPTVKVKQVVGNVEMGNGKMQPLLLHLPLTLSSRPDIVTMPEANMQDPGTAGAPEAHPVIIGAAEAGQPPRAVSPMDDMQATPHVTALEVDTRSTTPMGSAMQEQHVAVPISAAQVDAQVDVVEAEGVAEPSTPLALPVQLPPPSPEHRATALLALTMAYDNKEQMEVDN